MSHSTTTLLQTMVKTMTMSAVVVGSLMATGTAFACDDKPCESAYLAETKEHIKNHVRHAETYKTERHEHSSNRERRAYALYVHQYFLKHGWDYPNAPKSDSALKKTSKNTSTHTPKEAKKSI